MRTNVLSGTKKNQINFLTSTHSDLEEQRSLAVIASDVQAPNRDRKVFSELQEIVRAENRLPFDLTEQERFYVRNHGDKDVAEYLTYRYKFFLASTKKVAFDFPPYLLIEPVSACNLRCPMCFQVDRTFTRKPFMGVMKMDLFHSVVDQAAVEGCYAITLASRGEPMMHPKIGEMVQYITDKKSFYDIKLNTNATLLTDEKCHQLLSSGLTVLVFSIDHYDRQKYESIRVNAKYDEVRRNIDNILEIRSKHYPDSKCEFRVSGVRVDPDIDEEKFAAHWGTGVSSVTLADTVRRWDTYKNALHPENASVCSFLFDRMYVWFDGKCNPCDEDYKSELSYGDATQQPLKEIWNGPKLARLRALHFAGRRGEINPCDRCGLCF